MGSRSRGPEGPAKAAHERAFIKEHDSSDVSKHDGFWYIIDASWLDQWKKFATGKSQQPPGEIDNSRLVDSSGSAKLSLKPGDHYRGVNNSVWEFWHGIYGGGPLIRAHGELDIYRADVGGVRQAERSLSSKKRSSSSSVFSQKAGKSYLVSSDASGSIRSNQGLSNNGSTMPGLRSNSGRRAPSEAARSTLSHAAKSRLSSGVSGTQSSSSEKCDKCDGPHETDACPHFRKSREKHKDAWVNYGNKSKGDKTVSPRIVRNARVVRQPGDGSCLFHSLAYGLGGSTSASALRTELAEYISRNPHVTVADDTIEEWVSWDSGQTVSQYARKMRSGSHWGGAVEIVACTRAKRVNVHVWERSGSAFKQISTFDCPGATKTVNVLYGGRVHYDALQV